MWLKTLRFGISVNERHLTLDLSWFALENHLAENLWFFRLICTGLHVVLNNELLILKNYLSKVNDATTGKVWD